MWPYMPSQIGPGRNPSKQLTPKAGRWSCLFAVRWPLGHDTWPCLFVQLLTPLLSLSASLAVQSVSGFSSPSPQTRPLNVASNRSVCSSRRSFHVCKAVELAVSGLTCCCCYSYSRLPIARRDQILIRYAHTHSCLHSHPRLFLSPVSVSHRPPFSYLVPGFNTAAACQRVAYFHPPRRPPAVVLFLWCPWQLDWTVGWTDE